MAANLQLNLDWLTVSYRSFDYSIPLEDIESWFKENCDYDFDFPPVAMRFFYQFPQFLHIFDFQDHDKDGVVFDGFHILENYRHYQSGIFGVNSILILFDLDPTNRGVCVNIPSQGLWILDEWFGFKTLRQALKFFKYSGFKFTRVDICFDDFNYRDPGHFKAHEFSELYRKDAIVTRCRRRRNWSEDKCRKYDFLVCDEEVIEEDGYRSKGWDGSTFYLGTRQSERMLRIYDKFIESAKKAKYKNDPSLFVDSVRYEFQIRAGYSEHLVDCLISERNLTLADFCNDWFRIVDIEGHEDVVEKRKLDPYPKWQDFIDLEFSEDLSEESSSLDLIPIWKRRKNTSNFDSRVRYFDKALEELFFRKLITMEDPRDWIQQSLNRIRAGDVSDRFKQDLVDKWHSSYSDALFKQSIFNKK